MDEPNDDPTRLQAPADRSASSLPAFRLSPKEGDGSRGAFEIQFDLGQSIAEGQMFSHYLIQSELGRGGMGIVYKALDTKLKRVVALKIILKSSVTERNRQRLMREAAAMAQLEHPNITRIYEIGESPQDHFAMEYVEGVSLSSLIKAGKIQFKQSAGLLQKVAEALHTAHRKKILHRDLKPSNVMVTLAGEPKLMDFGLAKIRDLEVGSAWKSQDARSLTQAGDVLGTPSYMAPEQMDGEAVEESDIYSLGATLYEALTGRPPFQGETYYNILAQISTEQPVRPRALNPQIPAPLEAICLKCLQKSPRKRYANAALLAKDLRNFLADRPISAVPPTKFERARNFVRRNKALCASVAAVSILVGTLLCLLIAHNIELSKRLRAASRFQIPPNSKEWEKERRNWRILAGGMNGSLRYAWEKKKEWFQDAEFAEPLTEACARVEIWPDGVEWEWLRTSAPRNFRQDEPKNAASDVDEPKDASPEAEGKAKEPVPEEKGQVKVGLNRFTIAGNEAFKNAAQAMHHWELGTAAYRERRFDEAEKNYDRAIELDPRYAPAYNGRGLVFEQLGKWKEAERDYSKAIELHTQYLSAHLNRGKLFYLQGKYPEAKADLDRAIELDPKVYEPYLQRGMLHYAAGRMAEAERDYNRAAERSSEDPALFANRGMLFYKQGRWDEAKRDYDAALKLAPRSARIYCNRGDLHRVQRKYAEAERDYDTAVEIDPRDAHLVTARGTLHLEQRRYSQAIEDLQKAIELNPSLRPQLEPRIRQARAASGQ